MEKDEILSNEIESQCPQMIALFEGSQAWTDEEISQLKFDKSEDIIENDDQNNIEKDDKGILLLYFISRISNDSKRRQK